jgi:hypothetical protein
MKNVNYIKSLLIAFLFFFNLNSIYSEPINPMGVELLSNGTQCPGGVCPSNPPQCSKGSCGQTVSPDGVVSIQNCCSGYSCQAGTCMPTCNPGQCGGSCPTCPSGQACRNGTCVSSGCSSGKMCGTSCCRTSDEQCVTLRGVSYCSGCSGTKVVCSDGVGFNCCPAGSMCNGSQCGGSGCPTGTCSTNCPCPTGKSCQNGTCQPICAPGTCSTSCPCPSGQNCQNGKCQPICVPGSCSTNCPCPSGQNCQNGKCLPEEPNCKEDEIKCGKECCKAFGKGAKVCGQSSYGSSCTSCSSGRACFGTCCALDMLCNLITKSCDPIGKPCPDGESKCDGVCCKDGSCLNGKICCSSGPACGNTCCGSGHTCENGSCRIPCKEGQVRCSGGSCCKPGNCDPVTGGCRIDPPVVPPTCTGPNCPQPPTCTGPNCPQPPTCTGPNCIGGIFRPRGR